MLGFMHLGPAHLRSTPRSRCLFRFRLVARNLQLQGSKLFFELGRVLLSLFQSLRRRRSIAKASCASTVAIAWSSSLPVIILRRTQHVFYSISIDLH
jgi:hypothetical protein